MRTANIFLPAFAYPENNLQNVQKQVANPFPGVYGSHVAASNEPQNQKEPHHEILR